MFIKGVFMKKGSKVGKTLLTGLVLSAVCASTVVGANKMSDGVRMINAHSPKAETVQKADQKGFYNRNYNNDDFLITSNEKNNTSSNTDLGNKSNRNNIDKLMDGDSSTGNERYLVRVAKETPKITLDEYKTKINELNQKYAHMYTLKREMEGLEQKQSAYYALQSCYNQEIQDLCYDLAGVTPRDVFGKPMSRLKKVRYEFVKLPNQSTSTNDTKETKPTTRPIQNQQSNQTNSPTPQTKVNPSTQQTYNNTQRNTESNYIAQRNTNTNNDNRSNATQQPNNPQYSYNNQQPKYTNSPNNATQLNNTQQTNNYNTQQTNNQQSKNTNYSNNIQNQTMNNQNANQSNYPLQSYKNTYNDQQRQIDPIVNYHPRTQTPTNPTNTNDYQNNNQATKYYHQSSQNYQTSNDNN